MTPLHTLIKSQFHCSFLLHSLHKSLGGVKKFLHQTQTQTQIPSSSSPHYQKMVGSKKHSSAKNKNRPSSIRSGKDKISVAREYGEGLVGSRVRVWWPIDRKFYQGVVDSYASSKKKHKVLYDDGDVENLDMKKEKWELIEEDDAEADQDESADESSKATPEPLDRKKAKSNGKSSVKGRTEDDTLKKKQKIDSSAKSMSKARSGKISDDSEEEKEKPKSGVKKAEKSKDVEKKSPKPEAEKNGKMGDIGGKIVAAASRMSGRFRSKENGHEKEIPKALKSSKEVSESKNSKQKRPPSSFGAVYAKVKKPRTSSKKVKSNFSDGEEGGDDDDTSDDESNPKALKSSKKVSESKNAKQKRSSSSLEAVSEDGDDAENDTSDDENGQEKEIPKSLKSDKKVSESNNGKQKRPSSSSESDSVKVKKPRTSSKKTKSNNADDEDGDTADGDDADDDTSHDESKPLASFLKKSPEAVEALMEKLKGKKEKEAGEGSSGKEISKISNKE